MNSVIVYVWLVPAVPFVLSLAILSWPRSARRSAATLAVIGQVAALILSIFAFAATLQTRGFRAFQNFTWFTFGEQTLRLGFILDPLGAAMLGRLALVGLCIFVFSIGYMAD